MTKLGNSNGENKPNGRGRPNHYEPHADEWNLKAWLLALQGLRNIDICKKLGISTATLFEWQQKYPDFASALKRGRAVACGKLEETLFSLAMGREIEETKTIGILKRDSKGNIIYKDTEKKVPEVIPHRVERVKKVVLPDLGALLACLRAWKPKEWNLAQRMALCGDADAPPVQVELANLTDEQLLKRVQEIASRIQGNSGGG
jgi:hypothetical protein